MNTPGGRLCRAISYLFLAALAHPLLQAAIVRGRVTDTTGAAVRGASVTLFQAGQLISHTLTLADGSYQITVGNSGYFEVVVSGASFRQLRTPSFYAGRLDAIDQNVVLEPDYVRQQIVVTATGSPIPQAQTSFAIHVLDSADFGAREELLSTLRLVPGAVVVEAGQRGSQTSLFVRGGNSDASRTIMDGATADDLGGRFDLSMVSTTGVENAELFRGPNSSLYGADAASGVLRLATPHGTTSFPTLIYSGDAGNFGTYRNQGEVSGTWSRIDYYGAYSRLDTSNSLPMDRYHVGTTVANIGLHPGTRTELRATLRDIRAAVGTPGAYGFYGLSNDGRQDDQATYVTASVTNQTLPNFRNQVWYSLARKYEQAAQWFPAGIPAVRDLGFGPETLYLGNFVTIRGANGFSASGQAILNYGEDAGGVYPNHDDRIDNRDELHYQGEYQVTPHLAAILGFRYEDERGAAHYPAYAISEDIDRTNYDYRLALNGDFRNRLFYSLGGGLEHYQAFGTEAEPRIGVTYYLVRPAAGAFRGTRVNFNFGKGLREPNLNEQTGSLYQVLGDYGQQETISALHLGPLQAPMARTWEGGAEQSLLSEHLMLRVNYFHNQFGRQIETVSAGYVPLLLPGLSAAQQLQLVTAIRQSGAYSLSVNSQAFRAQGVETELQSGIGRSIFLRGGYTYLDARVERSFDSDNLAVLGGYPPTLDGIAIGSTSPLVGARPFRRPAHTGFLSAAYASGRLSASLQAAFAGRSDDSTFLAYSDAGGGNSLLLPNRNLDWSYARIDLGGSFQLRPWLAAYAQINNLTSSQHIAPIGYPSLPLNFRTGLRILLGRTLFR